MAVNLPVYDTYTYHVPEALLADAVPGKRVAVPFGNREASGYILDWCQPEGVSAIKPVTAIIDSLPLFPPGLIEFFRWIAAYYLYPIGEAIQCALPAKLAASGSDSGTGRRSRKKKDAIGEDIRPDEPPVLTPDQQEIVDDVSSRIGGGGFPAF